MVKNGPTKKAHQESVDTKRERVFFPKNLLTGHSFAGCLPRILQFEKDNGPRPPGKILSK